MLTSVDNASGGQSYTTSMSAVGLMALLAMLPTMVIVMTPFLRIAIVLSTLRQAMGLQNVPTNKVMASLALVVSMFIMTPVIEKIHQEAAQPYFSGEIQLEEAVSRAQVPLRTFMLNHAKTEHVERFLEMSGREYTTKDEIPFTVVVVSFVTSEIQTALKIGFLIYLPFVLIDLLVATVLMSLGLMMMSPMIIAIPIKIMLFVLVDGWMLTVDSLAKSFFMG
ncbi:flagellar type III secretion system pore protein FliP [Vibrio sp. D431a]|nr:flagellar type III secretion system pore protein FliP [Vibrio sp. D431a]